MQIASDSDSLNACYRAGKARVACTRLFNALVIKNARK